MKLLVRNLVRLFVGVLLLCVLSYDLHAETLVVPVRWVRTNDPVAQSEVRDGVCVLYMRDDRTHAFKHWAERPIRSCVERGGLKHDAARAVLLEWHEVDTQAQLQAVLPDPPPYVTPASIMAHGAFNGILEGKQANVGDRCVVVTIAGRGALGHELKHCYDGHYHQ